MRPAPAERQPRSPEGTRAGAEAAAAAPAPQNARKPRGPAPPGGAPHWRGRAGRRRTSQAGPDEPGVPSYARAASVSPSHAPNQPPALTRLPRRPSRHQARARRGEGGSAAAEPGSSAPPQPSVARSSRRAKGESAGGAGRGAVRTAAANPRAASGQPGRGGALGAGRGRHGAERGLRGFSGPPGVAGQAWRLTIRGCVDLATPVAFWVAAELCFCSGTSSATSVRSCAGGAKDPGAGALFAYRPRGVDHQLPSIGHVVQEGSQELKVCKDVLF